MNPKLLIDSYLDYVYWMSKSYLTITHGGAGAILIAIK